MSEVVSAARGIMRGAPLPAGGPRSERLDLVPTDGSVARAGDHVSIYCAPCAKWIDCHEGIQPELALDRHVALLH